MSDYTVRLNWTILNTALTLLCSLLVFTARIDRANAINEAVEKAEAKMRAYCVSQVEFDSYVEGHRDWSHSTVQKFTEGIADAKRISEENNRLLILILKEGKR